MIVITALFASSASAQTGADRLRQIEQQLRDVESNYILKANPSLSVTERAVLEYGGLVNFGFLAADDTTANTRILRQLDSRLYGRLSLDGVHEVFGRLRFQYDDFNAGDSFRLGDGDRFHAPIGDRYWYKFDYRRSVEAYEGRHSDWNATIKVGRQYIEWASGLALSEQLYALSGTIEKANEFEVEGLWGATPTISVIDIDSSRPNFDENNDRQFFGGKLSLLSYEEHTPYIYVLVQRDFNPHSTFELPGVGVGPATITTFFSYDSEYYGVGSDGKLTPNIGYLVEAVYETGSGATRSNDATGEIPQTIENIDAWALRALLTYFFYDDARSQIQLETLLASGDNDRESDTTNTFGGNTTGTDDTAFNGFGYVNTGFSYAAPISNLAMIRLGGSTLPFRDTTHFRQLQLGVDFFLFGKFDNDAPIDETTAAKHFLGFETDVYANWRVTSDLAIIMRYGVFFPGAAIPTSDERHYFYSGVTYAF